MKKNNNIFLLSRALKYALTVISLSCTIPTISLAQDFTIDLEPGQWGYSQSTEFNNIAMPMLNLSGTHCLTLEESNQKVSYYIDKFYSGLVGSDCSIKIRDQQLGQVSANIQCQSGTKLTVEYNHSKTRVDIEAVGWVQFNGTKTHIAVKATSSREGECDEAHAENKISPSFQERPAPKALSFDYKITPNMAGRVSQPASGPLFFISNDIVDAFPYAVIRTGRAKSYGQVQDVFNIFEKGDPKPIFQIDGRQDTDVVSSIFTRHPAVEGPFGERVGVTRFGDVDTQNPHLCSQGLNQMSNKIICLTGENFRSIYGFSKALVKPTLPVTFRYIANMAILEEMRYYTAYPKNWSESTPKLEVKAPAIIKLKPDILRSQLKSFGSEKPVIIHFTSNDGSCFQCEKSSESFRIAAQKHAKDYIFGEVVFNPWRNYLKKYKSLGGVPTTQIYVDTVPIVKITGRHVDLAAKISQEYSKAEKILNADYSNVPIEKITSAGLQGLINRKRGGKLLLIHITSPNQICQFCVKNNAFFRAAATQYAEKFDFAELSLESVTSLRSNKKLLAYFKSQNIKISGLPDTVFVKDRKIIGKRPGIWPTMLKDLNDM